MIIIESTDNTCITCVMVLKLTNNDRKSLQETLHLLKTMRLKYTYIKYIILSVHVCLYE